MLFFSMTISSVIMLLDGVAYLMFGLCMIFPVPLIPLRWRMLLAHIYPSIFHEYHRNVSINDGICFEPPSTEEQVCEEKGEDLLGRARHLEQRIMGYLLVVLGFCRVVTSFYWGCGYIIMGLCTCLAEIGMLCNEMLQHDSVRIHGTMAVVLHNVGVSLLYIGCALPYCR